MVVEQITSCTVANNCEQVLG
jgi:hypothetical protein